MCPLYARRIAVSLLILGTAPLSVAGSNDLAALLDGVAEVATQERPGPLCVYGPEAFPVIVAAVSHSALVGVRAPVVAAGRWGAGRVVALGHNSYFRRTGLETLDTGRLITNALHWAAGERATASSRIGVVGKAELQAYLTEADHDVVQVALTPESLRVVDVVAMEMRSQSVPELEALSAFVRGGGGLVTASKGWTWIDKKPPMDSIHDYAGNRLLAAAGIQWDHHDWIARTSTTGDAVNGALELTHAGRALEAIEAYAIGRRTLSQPEIDQSFYSLQRAVAGTPPDDTLFLPRLQAFLMSNERDRWPSADHPVGKSDVVAHLAATLFVTEHNRTPAESVRTHPAAADFPGSVPADAPRLTRTLTIDTTEPRGHATGPEGWPDAPRWHSTGLYAVPGDLVTVTVPARAANGGLFVRVGAHSDGIWSRSEWTRMPEISRRFPISASRTPVANAFGGLIYIEVPVEADLGKIAVTVAGAVAAPLFVLGETDPAVWRNEIRHAPGPWAEIAGRNMIVTTDAREVRGLDDPASVAKTWDRVLGLNAELAAWPSPARLRRERIVVDRQISLGVMHSGYPIMAHLDQQANIVDVDHLRTEGNWGFFHEVGHNHQSSDWTFEGTVEVTCNLFTLYVYEFLCGIPVAERYHAWIDVRTREMIARYDFENPDFAQWKREPGLALLMYVQLQEAFGWDAYRQVFAAYRALPDAERPKSDDEKRDQWLVRFSRQVGRNLGPFFVAWGVPTSGVARASIADMPVWLPPESLSRLEIISGDGQQGAPGEALAQPLVVEVRGQFGNLVPEAPVTFRVTAGEGKLSGRFTVQHATTDANGRVEIPLTLGPNPGTNTVEVSIGGRELVTFISEGVGTGVTELNGDYRTWHLPTLATMRLGKGVMGNGDRAVALSPDGRCLAVASAIGVWLYEASTSRALALLKTAGPVHSVAFSPGDILAAGLDNGRVELWDVETGTSITTLRHADWGRVSAVAFSPDGTRLASGSGEQTIKLWDLETRGEIGTWEVSRDGNLLWTVSVAFSPDGRRLASGFQDGTVRLWDVATGTEVATLEGHTDRVTSVSFSPDGSLLASAGAGKDPTVRLWNAETQTEVATLRGHTREVRSVSFSPDGATLASGSSDRTVRLWDLANYEEVASLEEHGKGIVTVTFSPDGANLVSGATDGTVLLRDLETGNVAGLSEHGSLSSMALSPDGATLASGSRDGTVRLRDAATGAVIATLNAHTSWVNSVSFSPDGALLASGSSDRTVRLWDMKTQDLIGTMEGYSGAVYGVSFSPDGTHLASGSSDRTVKLWDVTTRELIGTLEGHTERVYGVSFSHDSAILASAGGADKTVKLWDVRTRILIETLEGHQSPVDALSFSPDGGILASGSHQTLKLWETGTWEPIVVVDGRAAALSFSHDGTILAFDSRREVRLWDVASRRMIATLYGHAMRVHSVAISHDGATLASGSWDGTIMLWDTARYIVPPVPNPDFDGDGTVGFGDFVLFAAKFGLSQNDDGFDVRFDLDGNGAIGFSDFLIFANAFGNGTGST